MISLLSKIGPYLQQGVEASIALSGLKKADPRFKRFVEGSLASGYPANVIIDFIRDQTTSSGTRQGEARLSNRAEQGIARPDEMAAFEAVDQKRKGRGLLKAGARLAAGAANAMLGGTEEEGVTQEDQVISDRDRIGKVFESIGIIDIVNKLGQSGKSVEEIADYVTNVVPNKAITSEKRLGMSLLDALYLFLGQSRPSQAASQVAQNSAQPVSPVEQQASGDDNLIKQMQALRQAIQASRQQ